jgi:hypothetical protein
VLLEVTQVTMKKQLHSQQQDPSTKLFVLNSDTEPMAAESSLDEPGFLNPAEFEWVMRQQLDLYLQVC